MFKIPTLLCLPNIDTPQKGAIKRCLYGGLKTSLVVHQELQERQGVHHLVRHLGEDPAEAGGSGIQTWGQV